MKRFVAPLVLTTLFLSGCSGLHGLISSPTTPKQHTSQTTPGGTQTDQVASTSDKSSAPMPTSTKTPPKANTTQTQYIHLPNSQIDFNKVWIDCDLSKEIVFVKQGDKIVRSMPTSSGLDTIPDNSTPRGTFYIQAERGLSFYSPQYDEGAKYWVSFKDHGVFLFHSVVYDKNWNLKQDEYKKLGYKASHGCFRLQLEDAKWIYDNIKTGTKVVVHE